MSVKISLLHDTATPPDWFHVKEPISYFKSDINQFVNYNQMISRISISQKYKELLCAMFSISPGEEERVVLGFMVTHLWYHEGYHDFPIDFMAPVQDDLALIGEEVDYEFVTLAVEHIFSNPHIKIEMTYEPYVSTSEVQHDLDTMSSSLGLNAECPLGKSNIISYRDPIFEIVEDITPQGRPYAPIAGKRFKNGQLKLFVALDSFLTEFASHVDTLIYVGASPGINIASVALAHPLVTFYLTDLLDAYYDELSDVPNVKFFSGIDTLPFIEPLKCGIFVDVFDGTRGVKLLETQMHYVNALPGEFVSLKRIFEWGSDQFFRVEGSKLRTQVHLSIGGSELREWYRKSECQRLVSISTLVMERMIMYYNEEVRSSRLSLTSPVTGCNCYDCVVSGLQYARAITRVPPCDRTQFTAAYLDMFNNSLKRDLSSLRELLVSGNVSNPDMFGIEPLMHDHTKDRQTIPGDYIVANGQQYYCPPYRWYPQDDYFTVMYNGRLLRQRAGGYFEQPCMEHRLPEDFPVLVFASHALLTGCDLYHSCGCIVHYEGRESEFTTYVKTMS